MQDTNGTIFNPDIHEVKEDGTPKKAAFGRFVEKKQAMPDIEVVGVITNPELNGVKVMTDFVEGKESEAQMIARIRAEEQESLLRARIREQLKHQEEIERLSRQEADKFKLNYDPVALQEWVTNYIQPYGCKFVMGDPHTKNFDNTFHIFGGGKQECFLMAQPIEKIKTQVVNFCRLKLNGSKREKVRMNNGETREIAVSFGNEINESYSGVGVELNVPLNSGEIFVVQ